MRHVGINVAVDGLYSVSMTGMQAGLAVISADDPANHSSQNEQETLDEPTVLDEQEWDAVLAMRVPPTCGSIGRRSGPVDRPCCRC